MRYMSLVRKAAFLIILFVVVTSGSVTRADEDNCYNGPCSSCETEPGTCWISYGTPCSHYLGECFETSPYVTFCNGIKGICDCNLGSCG